MRIVQIIDSLEPGGAERMAVNYANALSKKIEFSGLTTTRDEGLLLNQIDEKVSYLFLNRRKIIDFQSVLRLRKYIKENDVDIVHAHSSSFFIAILVKFTFPRIKIIWHDHYGISQDLKSRRNLSLKFFSLFFSGSIAVNSALKKWARSYLYCSNSIYLPNFIEASTKTDESIVLKGIEGKRIICVANLRFQKNHNLLIEAAVIIKKQFPDWTFHLLGKDFQDSHSKKLFQKVKDLKLEETIFFYGAIHNTRSAMEQATIAVLPSLSEGLPLALLEYGLCKLAVVSTDVGEISQIIISDKEGILIESNDVNQLASGIKKFITEKIYRTDVGLNLYNKVRLEYSEDVVVNEYLSWLKSFVIAKI